MPWRLANGESGFSETSITFYPFQTRSTLTTMDQYQRVEKPRPETPIKNEIRITPQGRIRNYIIYDTALFQILDPFGDGLCLYLLDMLCIEKGIRDNCFHEVAFPCFKTSTPRSVYIEATHAAVDARFVSNDLQVTTIMVFSKFK
ncbi:hypothetical protein HYC85_005332 [Camellia sinensis]|uniref:Uncharacterized protein n=1 Tax=Camellia sinensis TaxID=4442 RepID=A0A7J7I0D3_CAMSI|nr:hypothetical protein HYC85_005332 [Camellia sinensis]